MHILSHPHTLELFSFNVKNADLVRVRKDGEPYLEDYLSNNACFAEGKDGIYSSKTARKLWEALVSQGFKRSL